MQTFKLKLNIARKIWWCTFLIKLFELVFQIGHCGTAAWYYSALTWSKRAAFSLGALTTRARVSQRSIACFFSYIHQKMNVQEAGAQAICLLIVHGPLMDKSQQEWSILYSCQDRMISHSETRRAVQTATASSKAERGPRRTPRTAILSLCMT